jgi:hypothetical protein
MGFMTVCSKRLSRLKKGFTLSDAIES